MGIVGVVDHMGVGLKTCCIVSAVGDTQGDGLWLSSDLDCSDSGSSL